MAKMNILLPLNLMKTNIKSISGVENSVDIPDKILDMPLYIVFQKHPSPQINRVNTSDFPIFNPCTIRL